MDETTVIRNVLTDEYNAILNLANSLNDTHVDFLRICENCKGKIIVTGMGKSGHVARKISATMASLGTPSFYLHPGEAAHGDLGMVEKQDVVIMISKSGETEELIQLLPSLKIIGCKLVGLFCKNNSSLQKHCDMTVVLPMDREACANNLAPTTSTTMTMAFGDAIAVALSVKKDFGKTDFALFHPKGSLGKQLLLTVEDLANKEISEIATQKDDDIQTILWHITKNRSGAVAVVDGNNKLVGLVSDGDVRRAIEKYTNIFDKKAFDIMTAHPTSIKKGTLAVDAFKLMSEKKISVLPIVEEDVLIGIVCFHDIVASGIGENK